MRRTLLNVRTVVPLLVVAAICWVALPAQSSFADHKINRGGGHGYGGSQHHVDITPYGIGYGFHSGSFGIHVGPIGLDGIGSSYGRGGGGYYQDTPYYVPVVDSTPIVEEAPRVQRPAQSLIPTNQKAARFQADAEVAFRNGQYDEAVRQVNHAIVEDARNGKLHLFASQAMFALGDYEGAAVELHQAVSLLKRDEWGYVVENYRSLYTGSEYVAQMDSLVAFIKENPDAAYARLVRGYHYLYLGYEDAARKELQKVVALESRDQVAPKLLEVLGGDIPAPAPPADEE